MQTVGIFEAKAKLSELVKSGEIVTITNHRKPVARIVPVYEYTPEFMAELERQCRIANEADKLENLDEFGDFDD
jgi:prevent-host-death family protein